jgi:hypothetical protein
VRWSVQLQCGVTLGGSLSHLPALSDKVP